MRSAKKLMSRLSSQIQRLYPPEEESSFDEYYETDDGYIHFSTGPSINSIDLETLLSISISEIVLKPSSIERLRRKNIANIGQLAIRREQEIRNILESSDETNLLASELSDLGLCLEMCIDPLLISERALSVQSLSQAVRTAEQGGADQPATASESKPEGDSEPKPEAKGRPQ